MVAIKGRKSSNKNPPILSHEFIIQNHADIVSCVAMVFVIGLMVQVTSPWAYIFIALHHNATSIIPIDGTGSFQPIKYTTGWKDACAVFFYFLIAIVLHAVIQEYVFDKISKRLRLSKSKFSKFNESSQLVTFYAFSVIWGIDIIIRENFAANVPELWTDYPIPMSFSLKLFFISQLAYWLHTYPELYFQRVKKEDIPNRVFVATASLVYILGAYILNFQQLAVILLVLHYTAEGLLHTAKLIHFVDQKEKSSKAAFSLANLVFIVVRILSILFAATVLIYGLGQTESSLNIAEGKFNIPAIRLLVFAAIMAVHLYLINVFIKYQYKRKSANEPVTTSHTTKVKSVKKNLKKKEASKKSGSEDEIDSDQGTKKNVRSRSQVNSK